MPSSPLGVLTQYGALLRIASPGSLALALAARAPYAMVPLGVLTGVTASTGSVAAGGLATGLTAISGAIGAPLIGRWADHAGQRAVLLAITPLNVLAIGLALTAMLLGWNGPALWLACLLMGGSTVPVGSFTRARWIERTRDPRTLSTAFSYESTADELTFVLGPALVGIAASAAFPSAPMMLAAALVLCAGVPFALTAPRELAGGAGGAVDGAAVDGAAVDGAGGGGAAAAAGAGTASAAAPGIGRVLLAIAPALIVMICIGTYFGSVQTATTERADLLGSPGSAGLVYAVMGIGSATTALLAVLIPDRVALATRVLVGGAGMAVFLGIAALQGSLITTALLLLLAGFFVGPTMVTAFAMAERRALAGGTGVAMTSMSSAVTIGVSLGATVGGFVADAAGDVAAYGVGIGAATFAAATGLVVLLGRGGRSQPGR